MIRLGWSESGSESRFLPRQRHGARMAVARLPGGCGTIFLLALRLAVFCRDRGPGSGEKLIVIRGRGRGRRPRRAGPLRACPGLPVRPECNYDFDSLQGRPCQCRSPTAAGTVPPGPAAQSPQSMVRAGSVKACTVKVSPPRLAWVEPVHWQAGPFFCAILQFPK